MIVVNYDAIKLDVDNHTSVGISWGGTDVITLGQHKFMGKWH